MDPQAYDDIIRQLVRVAAYQKTINEDLRAFNRQHAHKRGIPSPL